MPQAPPIVLVTGSSGFLGTAFVDQLPAGCRIVGLDRNPPTRTRAGFDVVECDLTKDASVASALATVAQRHGPQLASCVHLAAHHGFSGEPSPLYESLTVKGTRRLLRGLRLFELEQFIFSSTHIVMKPAKEGSVITEASPVRAAWGYPRSKLDAERVIRDERGHIPAVILRLAGVYDEDTHAVPLAQQMRRIYEKQFASFLFPGDADHGQAFVHIDDTVESIRAAIMRRTRLDRYEVCLVAEPEVMSYAELQDQLGALIHGREWPTIRIPKVVAKAGAWVRERVSPEGDEPFIKPWMIELADDHYPIAIEHARRTLGWEPFHRLRDTLPKMVGRLLRDPQSWYRTNGLEPPATLPERRTT